MSLNYDLRNCASWILPEGKEDSFSQYQWSITNGLIWWMLPVGFSEITGKNWSKVFARLQVLCPDNFSEFDIFSRIGLQTNCENLTDAQWAKRQITDCMVWEKSRRAERMINELTEYNLTIKPEFYEVSESFAQVHFAFITCGGQS